jgi:hypothetical protein
VSARIIRDGRTVWASREWVAAQPKNDMLIRTTRQVRAVDEQNAAKAQADAAVAALAPRVSPSLPGVPYLDPDGATYRVVDNLSAADVWVTAGVVMGWYAVPYAKVVEWVRRGLIDGVIQRGSPTKRYRIIDPAGCMAESKVLPAPPKKGKRK